MQELQLLFTEKYEEMYGDKEAEGSDEEDLPIEEQIKKELESLKKPTTEAKPVVSFIDVQCECVIFAKLRKPIVPEEFVHKILTEMRGSEVKRTRYIQKLHPVTSSCSASPEELEKLCERVLKPHFTEDMEPTTFAIEVIRRNFNTIEKDDIIKTVASGVGKLTKKAKVDLKQYKKLIIVECFKNNIGMSVVSEYQELKKYNVTQLFEKK